MRPELSRYTDDPIVWIEDPLKYTYLRESTWCSLSGRMRLKRKIWGEQAKIIGYEKYARESPGIFMYRVWWLKHHDRDLNPEGVYKYNQPSEAVVPSSIAKGKTSEKYYTPKEIWEKRYGKGIQGGNDD